MAKKKEYSKFSKAQVSSEFFIFIGLAFLAAIAFEIAALDQLRDFRMQKESDAVKDLALKLQREILLAASVEDGYVREFRIPAQLDNNINYTITTINFTLTVESKNSVYTASIPNSMGNLSIGANRINKTGGVIYIN